jgi:ribosome-associated protein
MAPAAVRHTMQRLRFDLDRDHVELHQLLKLVGLVDSGGAGKHLVASGAVRVDGAVELRKTCKIRAGQTVEIDGTTIDVVAL